METFSDDVICYLVKTWLFGNFFSRPKLDYGNFFEKLGEKVPFFDKNFRFYGFNAQKLFKKFDLFVKIVKFMKNFRENCKNSLILYSILCFSWFCSEKSEELQHKMETWIMAKTWIMETFCCDGGSFHYPGSTVQIRACVFYKWLQLASILVRFEFSRHLFLNFHIF